MTKRYSIFALILLIAIPLALAVSVSVRWTANFNDFNGAVYHCTDFRCNNVDNKLLELNSDSDNFITTNFNAPDSMTDSHAAYFTKQCYVPNEFIIQTIGDVNYNTAKSVFFGKKTGCQAEIDDADFVFFNIRDNVGTVGNPFNIVVPVKSAFSGRNGAAGTPGFIPGDLKDDYYSSLVRVSVDVKNIHGISVFTESKDVKILVDDMQNVVFIWVPEQTGIYMMSVKTSVIDCKCSSTRDDQIDKSIFIKQGTGTTTTTTVTTTTIPGSTTTTTIPGSTTTTTTQTTTTTVSSGGGGGSSSSGSKDVFYLDNIRLDRYSFMPGEQLEINVDLRKDVGRDLRGIAIRVNIPGLGISRTSDEFMLDEKEETKQFEVTIPGDAEPGDYVMDVIVFNDDRTLDRYVKFTVLRETAQAGTSTTSSTSGLEGITGSAVGIPDTGSLLNSGLFRIGLMAILTMVIFYIIWRI